jgi:hypothetical protein
MRQDFYSSQSGGRCFVATRQSLVQDQFSFLHQCSFALTPVNFLVLLLLVPDPLLKCELPMDVFFLMLSIFSLTQVFATTLPLVTILKIDPCVISADDCQN